MLTATQALSIADRIISLAQQARVEDWNAKAPPVPFQYRCAELNALQPWQRQQVIDFALELLSSRWPVMIALAAWILVFSLALMFFVVSRNDYGAFPVIMAVFSIGVLPMWVRDLLARKEIKATARMLLESGRVESP